MLIVILFAAGLLGKTIYTFMVSIFRGNYEVSRLQFKNIHLKEFSSKTSLHVLNFSLSPKERVKISISAPTQRSLAMSLKSK